MPSGEIDDCELWSRARESGPERERLADFALASARSELARRRAPREELEDLAQEAVRSTLAYVAAGAPPPRDLAAFLKYRAWGVLSDLRKHRRRRPVTETIASIHEPDDPARGPRTTFEQGQLLSALVECRKRLGADLRHTVELRYLSGMESDAIAAHLRVHRNTVHVRVHRALIALRECLQRKGVLAEDLPA